MPFLCSFEIGKNFTKLLFVEQNKWKLASFFDKIPQEKKKENYYSASVANFVLLRILLSVKIHAIDFSFSNI